jgi:hypothetical protein
VKNAAMKMRMQMSLKNIDVRDSDITQWQAFV